MITNRGRRPGSRLTHEATACPRDVKPVAPVAFGFVELKPPELPVLGSHFRMTACLTAPLAALESGELTAIAVAEPDLKRARQDSNL